MIRWSVVVASRNRLEPLQECLAALERLQTKPHEIVVVDDGSDVPYAAVQLPACVRLLRGPGRGAGLARNLGLMQATGDWVAITDDDCRPAPDWLCVASQAAAAAPRALLYGRTRNGLPDNARCAATEEVVSYWQQWSDGRTGAWPVANGNNLAMHRLAAIVLGGFSGALADTANEARDLGARWMKSGRPVRFLPGMTVDHHHAVTPQEFWRQHQDHGRAARALAALHPVAGPRPRWGLVRQALRLPLPAAAWLLVSQVATAIGYLQSRLTDEAACYGGSNGRESISLRRAGDAPSGREAATASRAGEAS